MDRYPCSCAGENPNCFRCYGTGLVKSPVTVGRPRADISEMARAAALKSKPQGKKKKKMVATATVPKRPESARGAGELGNQYVLHKLAHCAHCGATVKARRLESHIQRVHAGQAVTVGADKTASLLPGQVRCPECDVLLNSKNLEKHLRKVHAPQSQALPGARSAPVVKASNVLQRFPINVVRCSRCGVVAPNHQSLLAHLRVAHGAQFQPTEGTFSAPKGGRSIQSGGSDGSGGPSAERNMDGSHGWGGSFRDHGQFGSYPSFDSMDDESMS